jgi:hypothetical protein
MSLWRDPTALKKYDWAFRLRDNPPEQKRVSAESTLVAARRAQRYFHVALCSRFPFSVLRVRSRLTGRDTNIPESRPSFRFKQSLHPFFNSDIG